MSPCSEFLTPDYYLHLPKTTKMENNPTRHFIRYGLILALIEIVITVLMYVAGIEFYSSNMFLFGIFMLLLTIGYTIFSILQFRKSREGFMTLKEGFTATFFTLAIAGLLTTTFTIILYDFIDKEYTRALAEKITEKTADLMERFGASQADIDKKIEEMGDPGERFTVMGQIKGYLVGLIFYAVYSVILGAIFKRNKPPFEEPQQVS